MNIEEKIAAMEGFTEAFRSSSKKSMYEREIACLHAQFPTIFQLPQVDEILAGWVETLPVGLFPQEGGLGYYFNQELMDEVSSQPQVSIAQHQRIEKLSIFWSDKTTAYKCRNAYTKDLQSRLPSDAWTSESGIGFPLYRMSGSQLDYDKLLQHGLEGIKEVVRNQAKEPSEFHEHLILMIELLQDCCDYYCEKLKEQSEYTQSEQRVSELQKMSSVFAHIRDRKPENLYQAVQLVLLYSMFSGSFNYGRMDEYLGDFYASDLSKGVTEEEEVKVLSSMWRIINRRNTIFDGRVIVGGKGRRNPENADLFAKLALKVSREVNDTLPQLTLRFYEGQDPELFEMGMENIGLGCTYPLLYNDDVNIPAVEKAFKISLQEAENYVPFGCGEFTIYHKSFGTPSGVINLLKALEIAIHNGVDPVDGKIQGLKTGRFSDFKGFDEFYLAYQRQVENMAEALAIQEKLEYDVVASEAPFLAISLLYDDCISRGKPIFEGGIRYLGGTLETYGNSNTGDSLLAIKQLVFEHKRIAQAQLPDILKANFEGYGIEKALMQKVPKYGNDDTEADDMLVRIHDHICNFTSDQAAKVGLHHYLVVNINNHANSILGRNTHASADGREAYTPMANANTPSSGMDKAGITAMMNSIVKPSSDIHAGTVQNMKFSKELFNENRKAVKLLLETYFENGGTQAMITVLGKQELLDAIHNPDDYPNLLVRVGGFSARFIELDRDVQEEIVARTLY